MRDHFASAGTECTKVPSSFAKRDAIIDEGLFVQSVKILPLVLPIAYGADEVVVSFRK
jgi:hypothetical protein